MRPARLAPAMISTLGHRVPRRRRRGAPPGPGAIRPGSTLIEEVRFAAVSPPEGDDFEPSISPSTVSSLHAGARDTTHGANDRICHQGANAKLRRKAGFPDHGGNFPDRPI